MKTFDELAIKGRRILARQQLKEIMDTLIPPGNKADKQLTLYWHNLRRGAAIARRVRELGL